MCICIKKILGKHGLGISKGVFEREFTRMGVMTQVTEEKDRISSVTIRESGDDFTRMTFSNQERDIALPALLFDTTGDVPADPGQLLLRLENAR